MNLDEGESRHVRTRPAQRPVLQKMGPPFRDYELESPSSALPGMRAGPLWGFYLISFSYL